MATLNTLFKNIFTSVFFFFERKVKTVFSSFLFLKGDELITFFRIFSLILEGKKSNRMIQNLQQGRSRKGSCPLFRHYSSGLKIRSEKATDCKSVEARHIHRLWEVV